MLLAGIALFLLLAVLSLTDPEGAPEDALPRREEKHEFAGDEKALPERDILFDVLSIGAVAATVALVLFFF
jgi:hypothetical protein